MQICLDGRMSTEGAVVALGMFDGVHIGHQVLLKKARSVATQLQLPLVVQTFAQHPMTLIDPDKVPPTLTTLDERAAEIAREGADVFCAMPFTEQVRDTAPEEFVGRLVQQWKPKAVVVGFNYSYGRHGAGTPELLHALGHALGFHTYIIPAIQLNGQPVSATVIRTLLMSRSIAKARAYLGRPYSMAVTLTARKQRTCTFTMTDQSKLQMPVGEYRALLQTERQQFPVLVKINEDGTACLNLPAQTVLTEPLRMHFISEWPR